MSPERATGEETGEARGFRLGSMEFLAPEVVKAREAERADAGGEPSGAGLALVSPVPPSSIGTVPVAMPASEVVAAVEPPAAVRTAGAGPSARAPGGLSSYVSHRAEASADPGVFRLGAMVFAPAGESVRGADAGAGTAAVPPVSTAGAAGTGDGRGGSRAATSGGRDTDMDAGAPPPADAPARRTDPLRMARIAVDLVFLAVFAALLFAPGIDRLPPTDRDEARFVQATKQMLESGDYVDIRLQDEPRYKKPIGIYWLQAAFVKALGYGADAPLWAYRLPSVTAMVVCVLLVYLIGVTLSGPGVGLLAAAVFALSLIVGVEARLAKTDAVLLAFVLMAQLALARVFVGRLARAPGSAALFWTAIGCGVLVKGPVILMIAGLTLAALVIATRSLAVVKALYPLRGLLWALVITLPWFVAIWQVAGPGFFTESLGQDLFQKLGTGQESHGAPPGSYLLAAFATFWPGIALLLLAIGWIWRHKTSRPVGFLLAWALPSWVVFEVVATKLPHYVMPLYPALALLIGLAGADGALAAASRWRRFVTAFIPFLALALAGGLNAGFVLVEGHVDPVGVAAAFAGAAVVVAGWWVMRRRPRLGFSLAALGIGAIYLTAFFWLLPRADHIWASNRIAEALQRAATCPDPRVVAVGYGEPSLVFLVGTDVMIVNADEGARAFRSADCALAVVDSRHDGSFRGALGAEAPAASETVDARNLNGFRPRQFVIYARPAPVAAEKTPATEEPEADGEDGGEGEAGPAPEAGAVPTPGGDPSPDAGSETR